jgi:hypothetical protein
VLDNITTTCQTSRPRFLLRWLGAGLLSGGSVRPLSLRPRHHKILVFNGSQVVVPR